MPWDDGSFATSVDWESEEHFISENACVKKLILWGFYGNNLAGDRTEKYIHFCKRLTYNRSIEHLLIQEWEILSGDRLRLLMPFFENNQNIRRLEISDCGDNLGRINLPLIVSILSKLIKDTMEVVKIVGITLGDN